MRDKFPKEKEIFRKHIHNSGLRRTSQREFILDIFLRNEDHLTSEDLYQIVRKKDSSIGHTTVYRTLKLLTDADLAREVRLGDGRTYYEHQYDHEHHDHMICTECGEVIEFFSAEIEDLQDQMAARFRFKPTHHSLRILGICAKCRGSNRKFQSAAPGALAKVRVRNMLR